MKASRNELIRGYMVNGWFREAEEVARLAVAGLKIDLACPNREPIVRNTLSRVLMCAGRPEEAQQELGKAISITRAYLAKVRKAWKLYPGESSWPRPGRPDGG